MVLVVVVILILLAELLIKISVSSNVSISNSRSRGINRGSTIGSNRSVCSSGHNNIDGQFVQIISKPKVTNHICHYVGELLVSIICLLRLGIYNSVQFLQPLTLRQRALVLVATLKHHLLKRGKTNEKKWETDCEIAPIDWD